MQTIHQSQKLKLNEMFRDPHTNSTTANIDKLEECYPEELAQNFPTLADVFCFQVHIIYIYSLHVSQQ